MPLMIQIGKLFWRKRIDLSQISLDKYSLLNALPKTTRIKMVTSMVKKFSDEEILDIIKNLADICFDQEGALFIRKGRSSFLADIIKTYVDRYDGQQFTDTYNGLGEVGVGDYKCSKQSAVVFQLLKRLASITATVTGNEDFVKFLPANIFNKIWIAIILERSTKNNKPSDAALRLLSDRLQQLVENTVLVEAVFTSTLLVNHPQQTLV